MQPEKTLQQIRRANPATWPIIEPLIRAMAREDPIQWVNPQRLPAAQGIAASGFSREDVEDAAARLARFAPYLAKVFPELRESGGVIESPLRAAPRMQAALRELWDTAIPCPLLLKLDSHLAVSGSIKARGGFYAVLQHAEKLALEAGVLWAGQNYVRLAEPDAREFFSQCSIAVGSTGNLGLSVGLMGAALGFRVTVHMSADARPWKKELLRKRGVQVVEHTGDYGAAVAAGRKAAAADPKAYFIDDENSRELFLGYAVAGLHLGAQLAALGVRITPERPLAVYLPCGVGGGPGGVTFGLKLASGDAVACYFAEPTAAPAVTLGLISGLNDKISGVDLGLSGKTAADGLAVARPSGLVCRAMRPLLDGAFTVRDQALFKHLRLLANTENLRLEPSAVAGFSGIRHAVSGSFGSRVQAAAAHLVWCTGGSLVPSEEWETYNRSESQP